MSSPNEQVKAVFVNKGYTPEQSEDIVNTMVELSKAYQHEQPAAQVNVPKVNPDDLIKVAGAILSEIRNTFTPKWYKYAFDFAVILAVVVPITVLGFNGQLSETILGTLFGGIIGYTLSRFKKNGA